MDWKVYVEENPAVLSGKPVFKGTRLSVELILQRLGDGYSEEELLGSYPTLKHEHIRAAFAFAASALSASQTVYADEIG
ncbi:MAG: DUF433 domain-containing protein [Candidatus Sumerlaeaceae bacterium]|nr:DUF433 domain-containing protein [Candidatus Sumerlaeaceae bacterium]